MSNDKQSSPNATIIMVGLPETGKTTFLGALYHVLESGGSDSITLRILPEARHYLESVRQRWLKVESESRTSASSPIMNDLSLSIDNGRSSIEFRWPDLSGEYFERMVQKRTLDREVNSILQEATTLLFFIHPEGIAKEPRIDEVARIATVIETGQAGNNKQQEDEEKDAVDLEEWDPLLIPSEVLTVELLQMMIALGLQKKIEKIVINLSAWDVISPLFPSPNAYLKSEMPMLYQFLDTVSDQLNVKTYGVSALGGNPKVDKEKLLEETEAVHRIKVVDDSGNLAPDGILSPIQWLIG